MEPIRPGVVTFLFTDVQGSTRILEHLGDERYQAALADHHRLLREAFATHAGEVVGTEGDSFFVVFDAAPAAFGAVLDAQRALASHRWPDGATFVVRMGLHTGEALRSGREFHGLAVHQAARISSAAHGGQILVSEAAAILARDALPDGATLVDLGRHRLKDLTRPMRLYALSHPDLGDSATRLPRTLDRWQHNLPVQDTPLVGRHEELVEITKLVRDPGVRLITLLGPGGIGKTRLGLQSAVENVDVFRDGVWFVSLAPVADRAQIPAAVAEALGIRESDEGSAQKAVIEEIAYQEMLLVVDNAEHLAGVEMWIADVLASTHLLKVVVTSRRPMKLAAEHVYPVPPLEQPEADAPVEELVLSDAVRLLVERARAVRPDFAIGPHNADAVARICRHLDGLPLAIELAAARLRHMSAAELASKVSERLDVLGGGPDDAPDRHRTLDALVAWSYDLLDHRAQRVVRALSVFEGGWDPTAAAAVCGAAEPDLYPLVDANLIRTTEIDNITRFEMLETIRAFAAARLEDAGEADETRRVHAEHFAGLATEAHPKIRSPEGPEWLRRLAADHGNLRTGMDTLWDIDRGNEASSMCWNLLEFWRIRGQLEEGRRRIGRALELAGEGTIERARMLVAAARIERLLNAFRGRGELPAGLPDALSIASSHGDDETLAYALAEIAPYVERSDFRQGFLGGVGKGHLDDRFDLPALEPDRKRSGRRKPRPADVLDAALEVATRIGDEALATEIRVNPLRQRGFRSFMRAALGDPRAVGSELDEARARGDRLAEAELLTRRRSGSFREREVAARRAREIARELGNRELEAIALRVLGEAEYRQGRFAEAKVSLTGALDLSILVDDTDAQIDALIALLGLAVQVGDMTSQRRLQKALNEVMTRKTNAGVAQLAWATALQAAVAKLAGFATILGGALWLAAVATATGRPWTFAVGSVLLLRAIADRTSDGVARWRGAGSRPYMVIPASIGFGLAVWLQQPRIGAALALTTLIMSARLMRTQPTARTIATGLGLVGVIAAVVGGPESAFAWLSTAIASSVVGTIALGFEAGRGIWRIAAVGGWMIRLWAVVLGFNLFASWRTDGAFDLGAWGDFALPATLAGVAVVGVVLATSGGVWVLGGTLVAVTAPAQAWVVSSPDQLLAVVAGVAFGIGWIVIGVARRLDRPFAKLFPIYDSDSSIASGSTGPTDGAGQRSSKQRRTLR